MAEMRLTILAGDVGGTNTRLAFYEVEGGNFREITLKVYPSDEYDSLESIVKEFSATLKQPVTRACFGVAGPVVKGRCKTPNLAWVIERDHLAAALGIDAVDLINDLEANAYGIGALGPVDFAPLSEGSPDESGNAALISAGTGLGQAGLFRHGKELLPFASEGGHTDFAPRTDLEVELLRYLLNRYERVSFERVLSGPGIYNIYRFLRDTGRGDEPPWLTDEIEKGDPAAIISRAALDGKSELCAHALDLFCSIYGAEAGNLALKFKATGGVFVGGGIAPKILPKLVQPAFMESFRAKGRMRKLLELIPVKVILNDQTALLGAARLGVHSLKASAKSRDIARRAPE